MFPILKTGVINACLRLDGKMETVIELLKPERRKSENIFILSLIIFVAMSVFWLAFAESKLKTRILFPVGHFNSEYAWVIAIFHNGFNDWIVDVIWNRFTVSIFCNFQVAYNIGKEGI